jgi:HSP20 family protein
MTVSQKAKEKLDEAGKEIKEAVEGLKKDVAELANRVKDRLKGTSEEVRESAEELAQEVKTLSDRVKELIPRGKRKRQLPVRVDRYPEYQPDVWEQPFLDLRRASDRLFEDFYQNLKWPLTEGRGPWAFPSEISGPEWPRVDMEETDEAIRLTAELPGVDKDNIDISVTDETITIKGEKKQEEEKKGKGYYKLERSYGSFQRSFYLPCEVEADEVNATFKNGVLTIALPKSPAAKESVKKIPVRTG